MKKRFTEEQIIGVLKEAEAGLKPAELCRKHGISEATYYNWKAKFGGMTVSERGGGGGGSVRHIVSTGGHRDATDPAQLSRGTSHRPRTEPCDWRTAVQL